ncbi:MAG: hypothetical protein DWQ42_14105 [Planctomycetota bacterium]|nr:MAG: hypothetical protein DWQ42_14105 [Planctomycetota bacterium]REK38362.1 MAG: hypothetical protein DWQ46_20600 [Planctomycetota bacterium]
MYYDYGSNVYYEKDVVFYGDQPVATAEEYAQQAEDIALSAPEVDEANADWLTLGIFALSQKGEAADTDPTIYLQLAVSKQGVLAGTVYNEVTDETQSVEGMVQQETQRAAWVVSGKTSPIMETGLANLTRDEASALLHFADGSTQQWQMVRLEEPDESEAAAASP